MRDPAKRFTVPGTKTRDDGVTELLLGVLENIGRHEERILEADDDGDVELAGFLRELRRQDVVRARGATRLLRRSHEDVHGRR
jgi:hypothetical protein